MWKVDVRFWVVMVAGVLGFGGGVGCSSYRDLTRSRGVRESGVVGVRMVAMREVVMSRSAVKGGRREMEEGGRGVYLVPEGKWMEVVRVDRLESRFLFMYTWGWVHARLMNGEGAEPIVVTVGSFSNGDVGWEVDAWKWMSGLPGGGRGVMWVRGSGGGGGDLVRVSGGRMGVGFGEPFEGTVFEMVPKGVETVEGLEAWRKREREMTTQEVFGLTKVRGCEATRIRGAVELARRADERDGDAAEGLGRLLGDRNAVVRRVAERGLEEAPEVRWRASKYVEALEAKPESGQRKWGRKE